MKKRAISVFLALAMLLSLFVMAPAAAAITTGDMENAETLTLGVSTTVVIGTGGQYRYYKFTPAVTDKYAFYSTASNSTDTYGYLYNDNTEELAHNDDAASGVRNFRIEYVLEAGTTYYFGARMYSSSSTGEFPVILEQIHDYSYTVTTPATCAAAGLETGTCTYCQATTTREIEPLAHTWGDWNTTAEATCTEAGSQTRTCSVCGATDTQQIAALGHNPGAYTQTVPPTCTEAGEESATCARCGATVTREVAATGHSWGTPTSNDNGTHTYTCVNCGEPREEDCTYQTVTENGISKHTCTQCGYAYFDEAIGTVVMQGWYFESDEEVSNWTFLDVDEDDDNWERRTDESYRYERTGYLRSYGYDSAQDNWAISPAIDLTEAVLPTLSLWVRRHTISNTYVDRFELYAGVTLDPSQMTEILELTTPSTTYENYTADLSAFAGQPEIYIAIRHITDRDTYYLYVDQVEILTTLGACADHVPTLVPAEGPTCTVPGHTEPYYQCPTCGKTYLDAAGQQPVLLSDLATAPALGHDWGDWTDTTPATCTEAGGQRRTCARCGTVATREDAALGHEWAYPVANGDGTHTSTCLVCGATETEPCQYDFVSSENGVTKYSCIYCEHLYYEEQPIQEMIYAWYFESDDEITDWTFADEDNDGNNWVRYSDTDYSHEGSAFIYSFSWSNSTGGVTPDNWAITPPLDLSNVADPVFSFWAYGTSQYPDVYAVYVGTEADPAQMTLLAGDFSTNGSYVNHTLSLSDYVGQTVYVAIRHYNCTDQNFLMLDQVEILSTVSCAAHNLVLVPASDATCTVGAHTTPYYQCPTCGKTYLDAAGTQPVQLADLCTSLPLGHDWTFGAESNGAHSHVCSRCGATETGIPYETVHENGVDKTACSVCGHVADVAEGFLLETVASWGFESQDEIDAWELVDQDGDGYTWRWNMPDLDSFYTYEGTGVLTSASFINNVGALTPEDWAFSPEFSLVGYETATVSLWARGQDGNYPDEVFKIFAAGSDDPDTMVQIGEASYTTQGEYQNFTADLSAFAGQTVRIAIVHCDCTDMYWLNVDNVEIIGTKPDLCANGHTLTRIPAAAATCTTDGNVSYSVCSVCGRYFLDAAATQPTTPSDVTIPAAHTWGEPTYEWDENSGKCIATCVCLVDPDHVLTETVVPTYGQYVAPTATEPGSYVLTAEFSGAPFTTQTMTMSIVPNQYFVSTSLTLSGTIGDNLYVNPYNYDPAEASIRFEWGGKTKTVDLLDTVQKPDLTFCVTAPVAAKEMKDEITATLLCEGRPVHGASCTLSVYDYATRIINNTNGITDGMAKREELQALCRAMLIYGGAAQRQFGYHTDDLASSEQAAALTAAEIAALPGLGNTDLSAFGLRFVSSSLILRSNTILRLYFEVTDDTLFDEASFKANGDSLFENGAYYCYDVENISAKNLLDDFDVTFTMTGAEDATLSFNPGVYIRVAAQKGDATLKATVAALYRYCLAAKAYFGE